MYVPKRMFLTKGVGRHKERLSSFEMALRNAGIAAFNLVSVSSIYPPECKIISREKGLAEVNPGQILHAVISRNESNEPNRLIAASIGVAIPKDPKLYGYLSEHHSFGEPASTAGDYSEDLAAEMLATILDVPFDPDSSWDEKRQQWKISGKIYLTRNITQSARGNKMGLWTTVLSAAILLP
ncbi:MAG: arginine decarboxylase, pyruvoyl-dependent [Bacteroidetes bacterium]|nr:arginine decarboxylase, pyruvoyl-dependent [Bacteroidota bacterium]